jgi:alpha-amylase/alpha-mannosidase (GH57 family)
MERYLCVHCHFYQPPRENPWLETVELQDSAYPFHDWNERITAECYAPNSASRILDGQGSIARIVNNYSKISFNFGPTLLSWMEVYAAEVYRAILDADRESQRTFSGHGSAIAQAYNHMIMPLANRRDKETQVIWGIRDFEKRFGRYPEGMWLPETAVDLESLELLADQGIKYTILAPSQARQSRRQGRQWRNVEGARIDPKLPYYCQLPNGKRISLFFYDGPISRAVAFEKLLSSGENFANRLLSGFTERRYPQLMHIATDGETYGHHHPHGDMALAYALSYIENNQLAKITNYGEYLEKHPPTHEAEIIENTAWSCSHGVERWRSDCGCNAGHPGWNQQWRAPLRAALDYLRGDVTAEYEEKSKELVKDPWAARNDYVDVILDRSDENVSAFTREHQVHELKEDEVIRLLRMMEMQRHAMLMYTSCGWFFDELSGTETSQVIQYAARSIQIAQQLFGDHREERFIEQLAKAPSNIPEFGNGAEVYRRFAKPAMLDLPGVGAHYAISSLFRGFEQHREVFCYDVDLIDSHLLAAGRSKLAVGRANIRSRITRNHQNISFGVLHMGDNNLVAGVRGFRGEEQYGKLVEDAEDAFNRSDMAESVRALDRHFEKTSYSLKSLFKDEQRRVVNDLLESVVGEAEAMYRQIYDNHASLMRFLADIHMPLPQVLSVTSEFVLNASLRRAFMEIPVDVGRISTLLDSARRENVELNGAELGYVLRTRLDALMQASLASAEDPETLRILNNIFVVVNALPFKVDLWRPQNIFYRMTESLLPLMAQRGTEASREWVRLFAELGGKLGITVEVPVVPELEKIPA